MNFILQIYTDNLGLDLAHQQSTAVVLNKNISFNVDLTDQKKHRRCPALSA